MGVHELKVRAHRERIIVELQSWHTALQLWRQSEAVKNLNSVLEGLRAALSNADLMVHICLAGRTVARLGPRAHPNLSARLLRLAPFELRPLMLGWTYLQNRRGN
jgi:hypothetical protein